VTNSTQHFEASPDSACAPSRPPANSAVGSSDVADRLSGSVLLVRNLYPFKPHPQTRNSVAPRVLIRLLCAPRRSLCGRQDTRLQFATRTAIQSGFQEMKRVDEAGFFPRIRPTLQSVEAVEDRAQQAMNLRPLRGRVPRPVKTAVFLSNIVVIPHAFSNALNNVQGKSPSQLFTFLRCLRIGHMIAQDLQSRVSYGSSTDARRASSFSSC